MLLLKCVALAAPEIAAVIELERLQSADFTLCRKHPKPRLDRLPRTES